MIRNSKSRGIGWEFVHVCVNDHSPSRFGRILASERKEDAVAFLKAAVAWYQGGADHDVMDLATDHAPLPEPAPLSASTHPPETPHPKTNGKAERFIQLPLREWACGRAYRTSEQRKAKLPYRLHHYNCHRPHTGINENHLSADQGLT